MRGNGRKQKKRERTHEFFVIHVVSGTCDACVVPATLPDEFEEVVNAGKDVVHEDDGVKELVLCVAELVQRDKSGVADLCEVLDTVVKCAPLTHRGADDDAETDAAGEGIEYAQEGLCLVGRAVLVYGDEDVVVAEDG